MKLKAMCYLPVPGLYNMNNFGFFQLPHSTIELVVQAQVNKTQQKRMSTKAETLISAGVTLMLKVYRLV